MNIGVMNIGEKFGKHHAENKNKKKGRKII